MSMTEDVILLVAKRAGSSVEISNADGHKTDGSGCAWRDYIKYPTYVPRKFKNDPSMNECWFTVEPDTGKVQIVKGKKLKDLQKNTITYNSPNVPKSGTPTSKKKMAKTKATRAPDPVLMNMNLNTVTDLQERIDFIHKSVSMKPDNLIINDVKWKILIRSVLCGKNIMVTGPAGSGKTYTVQTIAKITNRPFFYFNLGSTQDPRSTLIGNTHYSKEDGTYFANSLFVSAIQTPNSIILLDELSRCHPEGWNILMTVLDPNQRYLRVDEHPGTPTIKVADGVSFIATANIGMEYTSTRVLDRALTDRFQIIEMDVLDTVQQQQLLDMFVPECDKNADLASLYGDILVNTRSESPTITQAISTRSIIETAELIRDGFTLNEAALVTILPYYSSDGGASSERTFVLQILEKYDTPLVTNKKLF